MVPSLEAEEPMYTTDNDGSPEDLSLPVRLGILEAFPLRRVEMDSNEVLPIVAQVLNILVFVMLSDLKLFFVI